MGDSDKTKVNEDTRKLKSAGILGKKGLLVVLSADRFGECRVVDSPAIVIGRQEDCDMVIADPLLSRTHCRVTVDRKGDFSIEDLDSRNSTFLNARKLAKKTLLHYGDRIVAGNTILRFFIEEETEKK